MASCITRILNTYDTKTTFNFASNAVIFAPTRVRANTDWVTGNRVNLEVNDEHGGIMVNNELAACSDVYVAGDLCSFPSHLGRRRIQGSRDHDVETAIICAKNMLRNRKKSGMRKTTNTEEKEISEFTLN